MLKECQSERQILIQEDGMGQKSVRVRNERCFQIMIKMNEDYGWFYRLQRWRLQNFCGSEID